MKDKIKNKRERYEYRRERTRASLRAAGPSRPRLSVYRSLKHIYAQVIDDVKGRTLAAVSSLSAELKGKGGSGKNLESAKKVGELIAAKAKVVGVTQVAFDRGGRIYHGRLKALAEAARAGGLEF